MKTLKSNEASTEVKCSACDGTGFPTVAQPAQPGRKIYPASCKLCSGKGRIKSA
jgi:DnaJ-class molecular chaperone